MKLDKALAIWRSKKPIGRAPGKDFWNTIEHCILIAIAVKDEDKRHIAKKPRFDHMLDDSKGKFQCNCGHWITHNCYKIDDVKYCQNCGQRLDWGEL